MGGGSSISFLRFLDEIGCIANLKRFPMHIELRIDKNQKIFPIEINPLRFCGWCTTDIAYHAYGLNVYDYYFNQKKPDWNNLLKDLEDKIYVLAIGHIPLGIDTANIQDINYQKFTANFKNPLELRKVNYHEFPIFAFLFVQTDQDNFQEIERFLKIDDEEYLIF